jgi:hypothetical protein
MARAKCRPNFVKAGFPFVDCPPLTGSGKNSADIHMGLEAVDLLSHATRFDEFIILSSDADFTPLLVRLRLHDRLTTAFVPHDAAAAFKAVSTLQLRHERLVEFLAPSAEPRPMPAAPRPAAARPAGSPRPRSEREMTMVAAITVALAESTGAIPLSQGGGIASAAVGGDTQGWAGHGGFARMLSARTGERLQFLADRDVICDPSRVSAELAASAVQNVVTAAAIAQLPKHLRDLVRRLEGVLDGPVMTTAQFGTVFAALADVLSPPGDPLQLAAVSRALRDLARDRGVPANRPTANYILRGIQVSGADVDLFRSPEELAAIYATYLITAFHTAGGLLEPEERALPKVWVGLPPALVEAAGAPAEEVGEA